MPLTMTTSTLRASYSFACLSWRLCSNDFTLSSITISATFTQVDTRYSLISMPLIHCIGGWGTLTMMLQLRSLTKYPFLISSPYAISNHSLYIYSSGVHIAYCDALDHEQYDREEEEYGSHHEKTKTAHVKGGSHHRFDLLTRLVTQRCLPNPSPQP